MDLIAATALTVTVISSERCWLLPSVFLFEDGKNGSYQDLRCSKHDCYLQVKCAHEEPPSETNVKPIHTRCQDPTRFANGL